MLIGLYNEHPALRKGSLTTYPDNDVLIFEKADTNETFLVLVNVRNETKTAQIPEQWVGLEVENEMTEEKSRLDNTMALEPFQYLILK